MTPSNEKNTSQQFIGALLNDLQITGNSICKALSDTADLCELLGKFDIKNCTPGEMTRLARKLFQREYINSCEFALLSFQPYLAKRYHSLGKTYSRLYANPQARRDFVSLWKIHLQAVRIQSPDSDDFYLTKGIVKLLESFVPAMDESKSFAEI